MIRALACALLALACASEAPATVDPPAPVDPIGRPWELDAGLVSRSISFENPTGEPGRAASAASPLGPGRKGAPARWIAPGERVVLCDIAGPGTIRHVWMTTLGHPATYRAVVVRAWWDGQDHPSVEAPLGDLFGFAHGVVTPYQSAAHSVGAEGALNLWLPMPFAERARIELANEGGAAIPLFFQIDYTLGDRHRPGFGRLHASFRRENPTTRGRDFEVLPRRDGRGRFVGAVIGVRPLSPGWWGEGELKVWLDGDEALPTIAGTGTEDYVLLSWGLQPTTYRWHGASLVRKGLASMYRWHLADPLYWSTDCRVTIQQIGHRGETLDPERYLEQLVEREDDWCATAFWYEPIPSAPLPPLADVAARTADLGR